MPSDDYTSTVRGSLKLKGSHPSGVIKKKKKKTKPAPSSATTTATKDAEEGTKSALQQALADEDGQTVRNKSREELEAEGEELTEEQLRNLDPRGGDGKTASERAYEEMRRKRVCLSVISYQT